MINKLLRTAMVCGLLLGSMPLSAVAAVESTQPSVEQPVSPTDQAQQEETKTSDSAASVEEQQSTQSEESSQNSSPAQAAPTQKAEDEPKAKSSSRFNDEDLVDYTQINNWNGNRYTDPTADGLFWGIPWRKGFMTPTPTVTPVGLRVDQTLPVPYRFAKSLFHYWFPATITRRVWKVEGGEATLLQTNNYRHTGSAFVVEGNADTKFTEPGVYWVQLNDNGSLLGGVSASRMIQVLVSENDVPASSISVDAPDLVFPSKDNTGEFGARAIVLPASSNMPIEWSAGPHLNLKQNTGREISFTAPTPQEINYDKDHNGVKETITATTTGVDGSISNSKEVTVGGLPAIDIDRDEYTSSTLPHSTSGIASLNNSVDAPDSWSFQWEAYETKGGVVQPTKVALTDVENTSGTVQQISDSNVELSIDLDGEFGQAATAAAKDGNPYVLILNVTAKKDNYEVHFNSNYAAVQIKQKIGALTLDEVPGASSVDYTVGEYYDKVTKGLDFGQNSDQLKISDSRKLAIDQATTRWTLTAQASQFTEANSQTLPMIIGINDDAGLSKTLKAGGNTIEMLSGNEGTKDYDQSLEFNLTPDSDGKINPGTYNSTITWNLSSDFAVTDSL